MARTFGLEAAKRFLTLKTHKIHALPIAILMPHSSCNCRCVMCDIWKGNGQVRQLNQADVADLLRSLQALHTRQVVMSGGEALLSPHLFQLCDMLRTAGMKVTILSTGLLLARHAEAVVTRTDEVIVSLDGSEAVHNAIRRVPRAYQKLAEGVQAVKALKPDFPISGRCVIQRENFRDWPHIIEAAKAIGLDAISFLPADISTDAFNRPDRWADDQTGEVQLTRDELPELKTVIEDLIARFAADFASGYVSESPAKLRRIYDYYAAFYGQADFPAVRCNAPWVSAVVEPDGTVRPCFFHAPIGNIRQAPLPELINRPEVIDFRRNLDLANDEICRKCVCSLNLRPTVKVG